jgi:AmpD protein
MNIFTWLKSLFAKREQIEQPKERMVATNKYAETVMLTSNYSRRVSIKPLGVVFHHSCGTWEGDIGWIMNSSNPSKGIYASYHCLIKQDGKRVVFGDDTRRMWHSGTSSWMSKNSCNDFMLGCAFSGSTYSNEKFGGPLNNDQINSAIEWLIPRWEKWNFSFPWITDHRQVSPNRKNDLNPIEWVKLYEAIRQNLNKTHND